MERVGLIGIAVWRGRRLPDAGSDSCEHVLELALGFSECPTVGVGSEREDLAFAIDSEAQAVGDLAVFAFVHADLASRALLHPDLLTRDVGPAGGSAARAACAKSKFGVAHGSRSNSRRRSSSCSCAAGRRRGRERRCLGRSGGSAPPIWAQRACTATGSKRRR